MQSAQTIGEQAVERYLADQMSAEEEAAFEAYCAENPQVYRDIEAYFRLREGLEVLRERGTLNKLLLPRTSRRPFAIAAAASIAALAAVSVWQQMEAPRKAVPALLEAEMLGTTPGSLPVKVSYNLKKLRGEQPEMAVERLSTPGVVELRILPSLYSPQGQYRVGLTARGTATPQRLVGEQTGLVPQGDGWLTVYLNSSRLDPGDYELSIKLADGSDVAPAEPDKFVLRIK